MYLRLKFYKFVIFDKLKAYSTLISVFRTIRVLENHISKILGSTRLQTNVTDSRSFQVHRSAFNNKYSLKLKIIGDVRHVFLKKISISTFFSANECKSAEGGIYSHACQIRQLNEVNLCNFKQIFDSEYFYDCNNFLRTDADAELSKLSYAFFSEHNNKFYQNLPKAKEVVEENVFSIFGPYYNNYWHFTLEYLPKILLVPRFSTILVPKDLAYMEILKKFAAEQDINFCLLDRNSVYLLRNCFFIDSPIIYMDFNMISIDRRLLLRLRDYLAYGAVDRDSDSAIVFLLRKSLRRINNDAKLIRKLKDRGIELRNPSKMSLAQQEKLFAGNNFICGYAGANWANLIYSKGLSSIVNLVSDKNALQILHHAIADLFNTSFVNYCVSELPSNQITINSYKDSELAVVNFGNVDVAKFLDFLSTYCSASQARRPASNS